MSHGRSILVRLEERGLVAPRVNLKGTERNPDAKERYEVLGELARGGVGLVLKGRDNDVGRDVALKVLRDEHTGSPELVQRFVEEAQIGGQLQHPGIVPVYELGLRSDRLPFFAMKLVKGETLAARLAARKDPADGRRALLAVFREVCRTMAYAHARGVIHRDLKPSNVMIGNFGEVQVVDWGFAKVMRKGGVADERLARKAERDTTMISTVRSGDKDASVAGSVMGTPAYMPPEQAMGRVEDLDERSDLFSLGAMLCEILTGKPPYAQGSGEARLIAASYADLEPALSRLARCGADARLVKLCEECLQPLPKDRPASAEAVADEIAAFLTSAEGRAHRARLRALKAEGRVAEQRRARRFTTLTATAVVAVLAVATASFFWIDASRARREQERHAAIESARQDAERLRSAGDWEAARAAAQRAIDLGDDTALIEEIRVAAANETARLERERDEDAFLAALEDLRARGGEPAFAREVDAGYEAAFRERGEEWLANSRHAREFAVNLGLWCWIRKRQLKQPGWEEIDRLARRVDPAHADVREALTAGDTEKLRVIVNDRGDDLPPTLAAEVGLALVREHRDVAVAFLTRQAKRAPGEYWIHKRLVAAAYGSRGTVETHALVDRSLAERHATAAVALRPHSAVAWRDFGVVLTLRREFDGAAAAFRRAMEIDPDFPGVYVSFSSLLRGMRDFDGAIDVCRKALALTSLKARPGAHASIYLNLSSALMGKRDFDGAVDAARRAARLAPDDPLMHAGLAKVLVEAGEHDAAVAACRQALALDRENAYAHFALGLALAGKGDLDAALEPLRRGLERNDSVPWAHSELGVVLGQLGRFGEAIAAHRRAGALAPWDGNVHHRWGLTLRRKGDLDGALRRFRRAIEVDPEHVAAYSSLGRDLYESGDFDGALAAFRRAVEIRPDSVAYVNLGAALQSKGDIDGAIAACRRAIQLDPEYAGAYSILSQALLRKGDVDGAIRDARRALELDATAGRLTILAAALFRQGDLDAVVATYRRVIELEPNNPRWHETLGQLLHEKRDFVAATAAFRRAIALAPGRAKAYSDLARVHFANRDLDGSIATCRRALTLEPGNKRARDLSRIALRQRFAATLREVLAGAAPPPAATERLGLAELCACVERYGDAVRLYQLAFEADPELAPAHGYGAGCAAAKAGKAHFDQARQWLRGYLAWLSGQPNETIVAALTWWQRDDALADVDPKLAKGLSAAWTELWRDVEALLEKAKGTKK